VLGADQLGPSDLRVHHPTLEDALVAVISEPATAERPDAGASRVRQGVS